MNKVTTINLNGRAYQVEEAGYEVLRKYLDQAAAKLEGNPDKDEIMADFEQAIAEKCGQYLNAGKDVITASEIEAIIAKMGPVETGTSASSPNANGAGGASSASSSAAANPPRRLYRIMEDSWIAGVCNGLGAYLNLKTSWVRLGFLVLTGLTHGFFIIVYAILAFVMPVARTEEDRERARGQAPFTANEFIEQAKQRYAEFQKNHPHAPAAPADHLNKAEWRKWKEEMKDWKRQWKYDRHAEHARRHAERWNARAEARQYGYAGFGGSGGGFFRFVLGTVVVGLSVIWILAVWSIFATGMVLGFPIVAAAAAGAAGLAAAGGAGAVGLAAHPLWVALIFVSALFYLLALPLKLLIKNSRPWRWGHYSFFNDLVQSIFFVFALYLLLYTARILFPGVGEAWSMVVASVKAL